MATTDELIEQLAITARPVRRLRPPLVRCALWLGFAGLMVLMLGISRGLRPELAERFGDPVFVLRLLAALITGVSAAVSVFLVALPDRSERWALLPVPGLFLWLSTVGYGCLTDWAVLDPDGVRLALAMSCLATLVLIGTPLSLGMFVMVRHTGPLRPVTVSLCAALAVAALTAVALTLFHRLDASLLIIIWNLGTAGLFVGLGGLLGGKFHAQGRV